MEREIIEFATEEEWLAARALDVTSTEAAALFGVSPYATEYQLHHIKTGQLDDDFQDNERTKWGRRLEAAIAEGVAEDLGLKVEPFKTYIRIKGIRMGSSFDFKVVGLRDDWRGTDETYRDLFRENGVGILEVKNVDGLAFRRGWIDDGDIEAPPHIEFQVQHQMEVADINWCVVAPLIGGNTPRPFYRLRDEEIGGAIREKVAEFWARIERGDKPEPDYEQDADAIAKLLLQDNGEEVDMSDNNHLSVLCAEYKEASADEKEAAGRKKALKGEIMDIIGASQRVLAAGFRISAKTRAGSPGTLITEEHIGQRFGARAGSRYPTITPIKSQSV